MRHLYERYGLDRKRLMVERELERVQGPMTSPHERSEESVSHAADDEAAHSKAGTLELVENMSQLALQPHKSSSPIIHETCRALQKG